MIVPENVFDKIRHCLNSVILCNAKDLRPDYRCELTRKPCELYFGVCSRFEQFPERFDN